MSELSDPPRLMTDPSAGALGDWFRDAQSDLPSAQQMARLAERLEPAFAAPSAKQPALGPLSKWLIGALGVAGLGLLAVALRGGKAESPSSSQQRTLPAATAPASSAAAPALSLTTSAPLPSPPSEADIPPTAIATAPSSPARNVRPNVDASRQGPSEAALLEQARSALATNPARSLALTRQHEARFPNGVLRQEREVIAIEALRRLGRDKTAAERAGSFEQAFPDSAHRRAVEGGLSK